MRQERREEERNQNREGKRQEDNLRKPKESRGIREDNREAQTNME